MKFVGKEKKKIEFYDEILGFNKKRAFLSFKFKNIFVAQIGFSEI